MSNSGKNTCTAKMSTYEPEMLLFVDETGCDKHAALHGGYDCAQGKQAVNDRLLVLLLPSIWHLSNSEDMHSLSLKRLV